MQQFKNRTLGADVMISIPSSLEEAAKLYGEKAVLIAAVRQACYGPWNTAFGKALALRLGEHTGTPIRPVLDSEGKEVVKKRRGTGETYTVTETPKEYIQWLLTRETNPLSELDFAVIAQEVADTVEFKIVDSELNDEPSAEYVRMAKAVLAKIEAGVVNPTTGIAASQDTFIANWEAANQRSFDSFGEFNELSLARALEIDAKRRAAEANTLV